MCNYVASFSPHTEEEFSSLIACIKYRKGDLNTAELHLDLDIYKMEEALITRATCIICMYLRRTALKLCLSWLFLIIHIYVYPHMNDFAMITFMLSPQFFIL